MSSDNTYYTKTIKNHKHDVIIVCLKDNNKKYFLFII